MLLVALLVLSGVAQAQKPTVEFPIIGTWFDVPTTLEGFIDGSDAAVIARVTAVDDRSKDLRARTVYDARVGGVIKEHRNLSSNIHICRGIGTEEQANRIVKRYEPELPAFSAGAEYMLFLRWDEGSQCFWLMYGPPSAGTFDRNGTFKPFTEHAALGRLKGLNRDAVLAESAAARSRR